MSTFHSPANSGQHPANAPASTAEQKFEPGAAVGCHVQLCPETEGGFSIHCLNLPGVISEGETEAEALDNIADAFRETIAYYRESNTSIPWGEVAVEDAAGATDKWIVVTL